MMQRIKYLRLDTGFTLVELLIAVAIFSIIILSLYSTLQTGILSYNKIDSASSVYQTARVVLNRIGLDLKNSFAYSGEDSKFKASGYNLGFFSVIDLFEKGTSFSSFCRIKYKLDNGILKRTCYQNLDAIKENPESEGEELSSDIKEISFQYAYATNNPDKPFEWQESWPKEGDLHQQKSLPLAVKIKLSLIEKNRQHQEVGVVEFNKTVSLPR